MMLDMSNAGHIQWANMRFVLKEVAAQQGVEVQESWCNSQVTFCANGKRVRLLATLRHDRGDCFCTVLIDWVDVACLGSAKELDDYLKKQGLKK